MRLTLVTGREKKLLALMALAFLSTRLWHLLSFPIFNDEAIYLQYAQLIHEAFVFSSTAVLYACAAALLRRLEEGNARFFLFGGAVIAGAAAVLFKQSGELPLYLLVLLPIGVPTLWRQTPHGKKSKRPK